MRGAPLVAILAAVAGCAVLEEVAPVATTLVELRYEGCEHQIAFFDVPREEVAGRLPAGFEASAGSTPATAQLMAFTTICDRLEGDGDGIPRELLLGVLVEPPREVALADAALHFVYVSLATSSQTAARSYAAWLVPAELADVRVGLDGDNEPLSVAEAEAEDIILRTAVAGPPSAGAAGRVRGFSAGDGDLLGAVDFEFPDYQIRSGTALLQGVGVGDATQGPLGGVGYHEFGEGYGITLRSALLTELADEIGAA